LRADHRFERELRMPIAKSYATRRRFGGDLGLLLSLAGHLIVIGEIRREHPAELDSRPFHPAIENTKSDVHSVRSDSVREPKIQILVADSVLLTALIRAPAAPLRINVREFQLIRRHFSG